LLFYVTLTRVSKQALAALARYLVYTGNCHVAFFLICIILQ